MTKPLTIEQIEAAFAIAAERVPKAVYKIERMMGDDVLMTFTGAHCLCIKDADLDARVKRRKSAHEQAALPRSVLSADTGRATHPLRHPDPCWRQVDEDALVVVGGHQDQSRQ